MSVTITPSTPRETTAHRALIEAEYRRWRWVLLIEVLVALAALAVLVLMPVMPR